MTSRVGATLAAFLVLASQLGIADHARAAVTSVDPDGTLRRDGQPWFPIGIYHAPGGLRTAKLSARNGEGAISVTGRGARLPDPGLPLVPPITVQLVRSDGPGCFEAVYPAGPKTRSTADELTARR